MKLFAKLVAGVAIVSVISGCASVYVPAVPPKAKAELAEFKSLPENKVFVLAVDPGGAYAYGVSSGKATTKAAAAEAYASCKASREANNVTGKAYIYMVNDKVVYEDMIMKDAAK